MKIKFYAALIAVTLISLLACNWFSGKKTMSNPLLGEWKIDSITVVKDTSLGVAILLEAINEDPEIMDLKFTTDSLLLFGKRPDTTKYWFDKKNNQVVFQDSEKEIYAFSQINDSTVYLTDKDSSVFFLRRK